MCDMYDDYYVPSYTTYVVDECGTPRYKVTDLTKSELFDILEAHQEWTIRSM